MLTKAGRPNGDIPMAKSRSNHGEGNPEAADEFNSREREFVNSARGKKKIAQGAEVRPEDEASLLEAERLGRHRSKGDDVN